MSKLFKMTLPIGALLTVKGVTLRYVGDGSFVSQKPLTVLEGVTKVGSQSDEAWPAGTAFENIPFLKLDIVDDDIEGPTRRRVACAWFEQETLEMLRADSSLVTELAGQIA